MKSNLLTGLLAITTMVAVDQGVFGQQLSQSLLNGIAATTPQEFTGEKTLSRDWLSCCPKTSWSTANIVVIVPDLAAVPLEVSLSAAHN